MAIGPLPPVISEIQANSGQPGKMLARQQAASSLLDLQTEATTPLAANILPETTLLEDAVAAALGRQGGLADLYATLTQLSASPDLPDKVKAAIQQVLAFQMGDGDVTPERLAQAIRSSGLFHEAVAAGKMMAALPQAVRQALGRSADGSAQVAIPTAARGAASPTSQTSAPPVTQSQTTPATASPERPGAPSGALASAIASYGRGSGTPSQPGATQLAASIAQTATSAAATPQATTAGTPAPTLAGRASVPAQATTSAGQPLPTTGQTPAASPQAATPSTVNVAGQPLQTATPVTGESSPLPPAGQTPAGASSPQPPSQAPQPATSGTIPSNTPMPATTLPATSSQQAAPAVTPQPAPAATPTGVQAQSQPATPTAATPTPASPNPQAPDAATSAPGGSKSFAPWTPGRPMTPPAAAGQPAAIQPASTSPAPTSQPAATASAPANAQPLPEGETQAATRPATDRALFVPSSVDSLPSRPAAALQPATAAASTPPAGGTPAQPGAAPATGQAQAVTPQSPASQQAVSQPVTASGSSAATPSAQPAATPATPVAAASPKPEAASARPVAGSPAQSAQQATAQLPLGLDLKGAIDLLRRELIVWLGRSADVMASADGADDAATARVDRPAPPRRNGPVRGQPAIDRGADALDALSTESLAGRALGEAERSLSRVFLHQAATAETRDARAPQVAQAMMMEIPIAGPNGTSIAQLRIERDEHPPSEPGAPPRRVFQVDVAFDIAPLGPVVVRVGLMDGRRVAIGVWCETDDGLVRMEAERSNIVIGLEAEGMTVAGVDLHKGHPPEGSEETTTVARNHRLDLQL